MTEQLTKEQIEEKLKEFGNLEYQRISKSDIQKSFEVEDMDSYDDNDEVSENLIIVDGKYYNTTITNYQTKPKQCGICDRTIFETQVSTINLNTGNMSCNICKQKKIVKKHFK